MNYTSYVALIPFLPLACFVVLGLWGNKYLAKIAGIIGIVVLLTVTMLSFIVAYQYFFAGDKLNGAYQQVIVFDVRWLYFTDALSINMGILLDPIAVMMLLVISFVSLMVHIFSLGYMKGEKRYATYYAFLSLFTFSMLGLVLSTNIFQVYIFWELVGLSSYLLIGFYFDKPAAVAAAKKAFVVTRFADLGFLIGILILGFHAGTLDFQSLMERLTTPASSQYLGAAAASFVGVSALTWGLCLIFIGGAGKSAMFPLHIWLPDAMEGPTPVSALIHAATMVVAGVYLVARLFPLFTFDGAAQDIIAYAGAFSALFAAVIACTQTDIKRVLAYSTMSQIGYMMFALGMAKQSEYNLGFTASMFHLFTHAFFKSLLFLCAGSIIHLIHSNQVHDMGGLRKQMPVTHLCFLIACLAIAGIPPFAGFFSKEEILLAASQSNQFIFLVALFTSALTAFYMFRLYFLIFWNKEPAVQHNQHGEGTWTMKLPLLILAACTVLAGFIPFGSFVSSNGKPLESHLDMLFSITPVLLAVAAILLAAILYRKANNKPEKFANILGALYRGAYKKFYIDELYLFITRKVLFNLVGKPAAWLDKNIVDGTMNAIAGATAKASAAIKGLQSGKVQGYALYFFAGIAGLAVVFIWWWK